MLLKIIHKAGAILKRIILFPATILRGVQYLFKSIRHLLSFSIISKISFNYIMLYFISCLIIAISVAGGYGIFLYEDLYNDSIKFTEEFFSHTPQPNNSISLSSNELTQEILSNTTKLDINRSLEAYYILDDNYQEMYSSGTTKRYSDFLGKNIQTLAHIKQIVNYNCFLIRYPYYSANNFYHIYAFYDIREDLINLFLINICMLIGMFLGFLIILFSGSRQNRRVLKPIYAMTDSAKEITFNSLDKRIDVSQAQYELKDLAQTLNTMLDRLAYDFVRQKQFVSDVSHELRTPIAVIKGYADMLDRWGKEDRAVLDESITALKNEANNMQTLVEKLLFLARHDNKTLQLKKEPINIQELLSEIIKETSLIDDHHQIITSLEDKTLTIAGDYAQLKQGLRIFVDNALKYSLPNGKITISAYRQNNEAIVAIKDEGIGIAKEDLPHIFTRFYRSDKSRTKETGGHGLGLAIARVIISNHSGHIRVRSKVGLGTTFFIHLPLLS